MHIKEINQPVVNVIWYVQLRHLGQQRVMSYRVEGLTEVQSYDYDIGICKERMSDVMK